MAQPSLHNEFCKGKIHLLCAREHVDLIASKLKSEDPRTVMCALGALESFGKFAGARAAHAVASKLPSALEPLPDDDDERIRIHAMRTLSAMGTVAAPHVRAIAACLELKRGGDDKLTDELYRANAAWALGKLGDVARDRVDAVAALLTTEEESFVRRMALNALGSFGKLAKPHVNTIVLLMLSNESESWAIREAAAETLGVLGEVARDHVETVAAMLHDQDHRVRRAALAALASFGELAKPHVEAIAQLVADDEKVVRRNLAPTAIKTLGKLGPTARDHVETVAAKLDDSGYDNDVRYDCITNAIEALESFATFELLENHHVNKLRERRHDTREDIYIRLKAAKTLGALGYATPEDVDLVARYVRGVLDHQEADVDLFAKYPKYQEAVVGAIRAFATFGKLAKTYDYIHLIRRAMHHVYLRAEGAKTLAKLGEITPYDVEQVAEFLNNGILRSSAIQALGEFGKLAQKYTRHPTFKLDDDDRWREGDLNDAWREGVLVGKALKKMYNLLAETDA